MRGTSGSVESHGLRGRDLEEVLITDAVRNLRTVYAGRWQSWKRTHLLTYRESSQEIVI